MLKTCSAAALVAVLTVASPVPAALAQTTWNMPTPYPDGNFHTRNVRQFADDIEKATGGKLKITVHSNGSLIKMPEIKRAVQAGGAQIGEILISVLANEDAMFGFESNPFLAPNYEAAAKLWGAAKPFIEKRLDSQGLKLLYSVAWPPQGIYANKAIESVADLKGTKFRTYSPQTGRFAELMGAVPTTVQVPEIAQAFRTGLVDAMITSAATGVDTQAWDYLSHYYDTKAFLPQDVVFVSKRAFSSLDEPTQKAVLDAAAAAEKRGWEMSRSEDQKLKDTMASKGIKVTEPSPKLVSELTAIGKTISDEWAKKAGPDGQAVLDAFHK